MAERVLPSLAKLRNANALPMHATSNTDNLDPKRANPNREQLLDVLKSDRNEIELPT